MPVERVESISLEKREPSFNEKRDAIFDKIVQASPEYTRAGKIDLVSRVFEHSAEDGKRLAERFLFGPSEYRDALLTASFAIKHPKIFVLFNQAFFDMRKSKAKTEEDTEAFHERMNQMRGWLEKFDTVFSSKGEKRWRLEQWRQPLGALDDLYLDAYMERAPVRIRKDSTVSTEDTHLSVGERRAHRYLDSIAPILERRFYSAPIADALPEIASEPEFYDPQITEDAFRSVLTRHHLPADALVARFSQSRVVAFRQMDDIRRTLASQELVKEINAQLPEDYKVKFDREKRTYRIVEDENKKKSDSEENKQEKEDAEFEERVLDEIEKGPILHAIKATKSITGFDSDRAWKMRDRLERTGAFTDNLLESLVGLDSARAWELRKRFYKKNGAAILPGLIKSLAGVDSEKAWAWRDQYEIDPTLIDSVIESCAGLESARAWKLRERYEQEKTDDRKDYLAISLTGVDSVRADQMRERIQKWVFPSNMGRSIAGIESQYAIRKRHFLQQQHEDADIGYALSLIGLDTETTRKERQRWEKNKNYKLLLISSSGMATSEQWAMRERLREKDLGHIIYSLNDPVSAILRLKKREKLKSSPPWEKTEKSLEEFEDYLVGEIEKIYDREGDSRLISGFLTGLDSERAWKLRDRMRRGGEERVDARVHMIRGLDSPRAWEERRRLEAAGESWTALIRSLAGVDSPQAWDMRRRYISERDLLEERELHQCDLALIMSLTGIDTTEAWDIRESQMEVWENRNDNHAPQFLLRHLVGLDSSRAWSMRQVYIKREGFLLDIIVGLAGLDSPRAWRIREQNVQHKTLANVLMQSLIGLDTPQAQDMRLMLASHAHDESYAISLAGLYSLEAEAMREKWKKDNQEVLSLQSLNGDYRSAIAWRLAYKRTHPDVVTSGSWQPKLDLLNLVVDPTRETVRSYRERQNTTDIDEQKEITRIAFSRSPFAAEAIFNRTREDRETSRELLQTNAAIPDRAPERLAEILLERMMPERKKFAPSFGKRISSFFRREERPNLSSAFSPQDESDPVGAGFEDLGDTRPVLESREEMNELLVCGIYGAYDRSRRLWGKVPLSKRQPHPNPSKEITLTALRVEGLSQANLPLPLDGRLITERVKTMTASGKEIPIEGAATNTLGEAIVEVPKGATKIVYSVEQPFSSEPMEDVSQKSFEQFVRKLEREHGVAMTESIAKLPHDVAARVRTKSFQALSPKEKVMEIEKIVRSLGYYDKQNGDVRDEKRGKSVEEIILRCEERVEQLRENDAALAGKRFAGVCLDHAYVTIALLREAGIPSGLLQGFYISGKVARIQDAHATAFVPWPDGKGGTRIISVDGMPEAGAPEHVVRPSLAEQEAQAIASRTEDVEIAENVIRDLIEAARAGDVETIRKLKNGKLERALNVILQYEVKRSHLRAVERVLGAYWYGGLASLDPLTHAIELQKALENELTQERKRPTREEDRDSAGTRLLEIVREFASKFRRSKTSSKNAFVILDRIANASSPSLTDVEHRAFVAVIEYLRAQKMKAGK